MVNEWSRCVSDLCVQLWNCLAMLVFSVLLVSLFVCYILSFAEVLLLNKSSCIPKESVFNFMFWKSSAGRNQIAGH